MSVQCMFCRNRFCCKIISNCPDYEKIDFIPVGTLKELEELYEEEEEE